MSDEQLSVHLTAGLVICVLMIATWIISVIRCDAGVIDICWGMGFAAVAGTLYLKTNELNPLSGLLAVLTSIWAIRLSAHLASRNLGEPEDWRYRAMREKWGSSFPLVSLVTVFGLQGAVMWLVSLPIQVSSIGVIPNGQALAVPGVVLWIAGMFFESVGDWQLVRFRSNPENRGRVLDTGLWRFTRHPNYFGDCLVWWGLFFVAVACSGAWWTIVSPVAMTYLLTRVSGVSLLENTLRSSKPEYADYIHRTNAFIPGRPRPPSHMGK